MTAPCQYPLCGLSERDPRHIRPCENHPPNISCHPYVPAPEEPTSALGYLLGELGRGATQSAGEKADGGGKAHEAKQGRAPTSGNEGSNPSPTSVTSGSAPPRVEPETCELCMEPPGNTVIASWSKPVHSGWIPRSRFAHEVVWQIHPYVPIRRPRREQ